MFSIQPFNQCLLGVAVYSLNNNSIDNYMIDASSDDQVKINLISRIDQARTDDYSTLETIQCTILDWETDLINQLNNQKGLIRAATTCITRRTSFQTHSDRACLMWKGVSEFNLENDVKIYTVNYKHECIGFVGGYMLMFDKFVVNLEKSSSVDSLKLEPCPEVTLQGFTRAIIIPSGTNILKKDYALTALLSGKLVYLFDLNEKKFTKSFNIIPYDSLILPEDMALHERVGSIPYLEENRLRSFLLHNQRLFELVWKGEEFNSDLALMRHLDWMENIYSVRRMDNFGLLLKRVKGRGHIYYEIYKPQPFNTNHSKKEGIIIELPALVNKEEELRYSPNSKCLISVKDLSISRVKTLGEINELPFQKVEEFFSEEEYLEKLKIDGTFNTYQPRLMTDACEIITNIPNNPRITQAYQIKEGCYNQIEIVAGFNCKKMKHLAEIIADDYVELNPEDFADYLGAPIIHPYYRVNYTSFLLDMKHSKRSSKSIEILSGFNGVFGEPYDMNLKLDDATFVGILSCKPKPDEMNEDADQEKEFETMFHRNEFKVESKKLIVTDPFLENPSSSGVIINNVRPGVWKWMTTNESNDTDNENDSAVTQIVAIHQDYYNDLSNSKLWTVPDNAKRIMTAHCERDQYYDDEIEGGWYVMKWGVGVYTDTAGIFDMKYFNNYKCLGLKKKRTLLQKSVSWNRDFSEWQNYLSEKMKSSGTVAVPYGIVTSCHSGEGAPCLFKRSKSGDVIAVRVIYC